MDVENFEKLDMFNRSFTILERLWKSKMLWKEKYKLWSDTGIFGVDVEEMNELVEKLVKTANLCNKELAGNYAALEFKKEIDVFAKVAIVITALNNDAMNDDHWDEVYDVINTHKRDNGQSGKASARITKCTKRELIKVKWI